MSGKVEKRGDGFRVRWVNPRDGGRYQNTTLASEKDGLLFKAWLASKHDEVWPSDLEIVTGSWRRNLPGLVNRAELMTFGEYAADCIDGRDGIKSATTIEMYSRLNNGFAEWLDKPLVEITRSVVRAKHEALREAGRAGLSIAVLMSFAAGVMRDALADHLIQHNPFTHNDKGQRQRYKIAERKAERQKEDDETFLTQAATDALIAAAPDPQTRMLLHLLLGAGLRIGEALAVRVKHLRLSDPDEWWLHVRRQVTNDGSGRQIETEPKRASARPVPLSESLAGMLREYVEGKDREAYVFASPRGINRPWYYSSWLRHRWWPTVEQARREHGLDPSLRVTPHALRHTFISRCYARGVPGFVIAKIVGHEDDQITNRTYGHLATESASDVRIAQAFYESKPDTPAPLPPTEPNMT